MTGQTSSSGSSAGLEDFELGERRGEGAAAVVYDAVHRRFHARVALKLWRAPLDDRTRYRFDEECSLQWRLSEHPNVVRLLWAHAADGEPPWTASALYEESLADRLARDPLELSAALDVADDLLAGLSAVHDAGALHRDVKPANVLLLAGRAAIGDFGIAMEADHLTRDRAAGTGRYLAPELERGAEPTTRSDVYSAAVTIQAALPRIPDWLESILIRANSHHPGDRHTDAADLRAAIAAAREKHLGSQPALTAAAAPTGTPTPPSTPAAAAVVPKPPRAGPPPRRRRRALVAAGSATVVVGAGVAAALFGPELLDSSADASLSTSGTQSATGTAAAGPSSATPWKATASATPSATPKSGRSTAGGSSSSLTGDGGLGQGTTLSPSASRSGASGGGTGEGREPKKPSEGDAGSGGAQRPSGNSAGQDGDAGNGEAETKENGTATFAGSHLQSVYADKCADVEGPYTNDGTPVQLWECKDVAEERWVLEGGELRGFGGKCLDVTGPSEEDGTNVQMYTCVGVPQQQWVWTAAGELRGFGGKCLDVEGPSRNTGAHLQIWECTGVPQQKWRRL